MECTCGPLGLEIISLNCGAPSGEKRNFAVLSLFQFFAARGAIMIKTYATVTCLERSWNVDVEYSLYKTFQSTVVPLVAKN